MSTDLWSSLECSPKVTSYRGSLNSGTCIHHRRSSTAVLTQCKNAHYRSDECGGLVTFPFASAELSLLTVHPRLLDRARSLLGTEDVRISSAEVWAKFSGAFDYEQEHHRDFLNRTRLHNVEMFIYLHDVGEDLGPTHLVSTTLTADVPLVHHCASR